MQKKKKPLVTQTAGQRQIRDPLLTLFLPCLSLSILFHALLFSLLRIFVFFRFLFFPSNFPFASYDEEEDEDETPRRNEFFCSIANSQCLCPLSLCLQVVGGGRTNVAEHKQNKGSLSLLSCGRPRDKRVSSRFCDARRRGSSLLRGSTRTTNPLTSTFSCHPPPPAGHFHPSNPPQALVELPLRCTPVSPGSSFRGFRRSLMDCCRRFPASQRNCCCNAAPDSRKQSDKQQHITLLPPLHCTQLDHSFYRAATGMYRAGQGYEENTIFCGRFKNRREESHH